MHNKQSEEFRTLSLQEMEETCGGDAGELICNTASGLIGSIWSGAVAGAVGGPVGAVAGALVGAVVGAVISTAAC